MSEMNPCPSCGMMIPNNKNGWRWHNKRFPECFQSASHHDNLQQRVFGNDDDENDEDNNNNNEIDNSSIIHMDDQSSRQSVANVPPDNLNFENNLPPPENKRPMDFILLPDDGDHDFDQQETNFFEQLNLANEIQTEDNENGYNYVNVEDVDSIDDDFDYQQFLEEEDNDEKNEINTKTAGEMEADDILLSFLDEQTKQSGGYGERRPLSADIEQSVKLLHILQKAKAPLYLHDEIQEWAEEGRRTGCLKGVKRETVIATLDKYYNMQGLKPKTEKLQLPSGNEINVTTHDFIHSLFSLLTDDYLTQDDNLLLNLDCPSLPTKNSPDKVGDIDTGNLYKLGWTNYCKNPKDVLCALNFFIDKTHTDVLGKLGVEPVVFTLSIFNQKTRNKVIAWRNLGYIPTLEFFDYNHDTQKKMADYHFILQYILREVYKVQMEGGLNWKFVLKGVAHDVTLKMPVMSFIGDTEGQDKLVGRFANRTKAQKLCRYCDIGTNDANNPWPKEINYTKFTDIKRLQEKNDNVALKKRSYHNIKNATHLLDFCDPDRGINGATPFDIVHTWQHGWHTYTINEFFKQKKVLGAKKEQAKTNAAIKKARKKRKASEMTDEINEQASVYSAKKGKKTSILNVFSPDFAKTFKERALQVGKLLQHQSDRDLPRTFFAQGIIPSKGKKRKTRISLRNMSGRVCCW